jgi:transcriptional regulator with XRE-family HTH domain
LKRQANGGSERLLAHVEEPPPLTNTQSDVYVDRMGARHGPVLLPVFGVKSANQLGGQRALILVPLVRVLHIQMIQRYQDGSTSIPASTLFELARALDVPPSCFFEGPRLTARDPLCTQETAELVRAYFTIHNPTVRENIAKAIRAVSHPRGS